MEEQMHMEEQTHMEKQTHMEEQMRIANRYWYNGEEDVGGWRYSGATLNDNGEDGFKVLGNYIISVDEADIFCFTGHKGLFGPQGTGGIIVKDRQPFTVVKTGGAGTSSFAHSSRTAK